MTKSILITEASQKNTLGIVRSLGQKGFNVYVLANSKLDQSIYSRYCKGYLLLKKFDFAEIKNFIIKKKIEVVLPIGINSLKFFSDNESLFECITKFLIPTKKQINTTISKELTIELAKSLSIPCPKSLFPNSVEDLFCVSSKIGFPCVIKWKFEVGENIVEYASTEEELIFKFVKMCEKYSFNESTGFPMIQEFIEGKGVAYFALFERGKLIGSYQHERIREAPPSGGVSVCAKISYNEKIEEYGKSLLTSLNWNGVAMVEFRMQNNQNFKLMEVNPKFWGSHDLALEAGINFPFEIINLLSADLRNNPTLPKARNIKIHWPLDGDFKYMFHDKNRLFSVLKDFLNPNVRSNLRIFNDPFPTFLIICLNFINFLKKLIFNIK